GNAKNILTVGAVNDVAGGYTSASGVVMSSFSGWGPTDDGRIKPDVCGNGVGLESSTSGSSASYGSLSGTSMATPNVSGALFLLQQHYQNLFGNGNFMRAATLKGLAIHTADEAGTSAGPDYKFGWGLVNVATAAQAITNAKANTTSFVFEKTLPNNASQTMQITSNGQPLRVTICWTDRPGTPVTPQVNDSPTRMLVNDLDSRISYNGTTTFPWILDPANPNSAATQGDNIRDNVEQILLSSTTNGGVYTLTIGHKGTLQGNTQAYSIWITGATSVTEVGALPAMQFTTASTSVSEGATTGTLNCRKYQDVTATLQINKAYTGTAQVNVQATGTASSGADYSILSGASL
ncbi:MAG: peptidase S8, partial [Bacteroidetes bacterium]